MADKSASTRPWPSVYTRCDTSASWMSWHQRCHDSSKTIKDQKVGSGPVPSHIHPFPKIVGIICHSWTYEITQPIWHSGKESTRNARDPGGVSSIPGPGRSHGVGNSSPLQYFPVFSRLQSMGSHRVGHDWSNLAAVAAASILAWEIPWTEDPGGLQPMGSQKSDTT